MKAKDFKESNKTLIPPTGTKAEDCHNLKVYSDEEYSISKWKLSWKERLKIVFTGTVWLWVWYGGGQPPVLLSIKHPFNKGILK